jgi:hypothetical protein
MRRDLVLGAKEISPSCTSLQIDPDHARDEQVIRAAPRKFEGEFSVVPQANDHGFHPKRRSSRTDG